MGALVGLYVPNVPVGTSGCAERVSLHRDAIGKEVNPKILLEPAVYV